MAMDGNGMVLWLKLGAPKQALLKDCTSSKHFKHEASNPVEWDKHET